MNMRTICWTALLMVIGSMVAAQPVLAQSNPPCARVSATAFVNWPQSGFDPCHTGYNPNEFLLSPATVGNLVLDWKYTTTDVIFSSPAVANGVVYVGGDREDWNLYALNTSTGALLWKYGIGGPLSSPAVVNGVVYVGGWDSNVYALNAVTGALQWKYTTEDGNFFAPAVANGVVYVGNDSSHVHALNAATGALLWQSNDGVRAGSGGQRNGVCRGRRRP